MDAARGFAELLAQHRDAIAPPLGRVVPQRIVAPQIVAEPHANMRTGLEARQVAPVRIDQLVAVDVLGEIGDRAQPEAHVPYPFSGFSQKAGIVPGPPPNPDPMPGQPEATEAQLAVEQGKLSKKFCSKSAASNPLFC